MRKTILLATVLAVLALAQDSKSGNVGLLMRQFAGPVYRLRTNGELTADDRVLIDKTGTILAPDEVARSLKILAIAISQAYQPLGNVDAPAAIQWQDSAAEAAAK